MDDADPKKRKPLTPRQQLKKVLDAVADESLEDKKPLTKRERLLAQRTKEKLIKMAEDYDAELDRQAAEPGWSKRTKKTEPPDSGHLM